MRELLTEHTLPNITHFQEITRFQKITRYEEGWNTSVLFLVCESTDEIIYNRSNRKSETMWAKEEFPVIQLGTMWAKQEISVIRVNQSEKGKSIMYNRNGKRVEWWQRELVLPHKLESPESWAFRFNIYTAKHCCTTTTTQLHQNVAVQRRQQPPIRMTSTTYEEAA